TNKSTGQITSFTSTINNPSKPELVVNVANIPDTTIEADSQTQQMIMTEAHNLFTKPPTIRITYLAGALQGLTLQLPIVITKFMEPAKLSGEDFFKRWKQIGGEPRESQQVFGLLNPKHRKIDATRIKR